MITIVIPSRTDAHLERLFESIERSQPGWLDKRGDLGQPGIIVADNGITDEFKAGRWGKVATFIKTEVPFVFSRAMNDGAREALRVVPDSDLLLMNDDTEIVTPEFIISLERVLLLQESFAYGLLCPRIVGGVGNPLQMQRLDPNELREISTTICFVCVLIPNRVWDKVGPMDERFTAYGFDDDDYCRRVRVAGWKCGIMGAATVNHGFGGHTMSGTYARVHGAAQLREMFFQNKDLLEDKWRAIDRDNRMSRRVVNDLTTARRLSLGDLVDGGYLQEANRQFFHPVGLTLQVKRAPDGSPIDFYVLDFRDIPEGVFLDDGVLSSEKAEKIDAELAGRQEARVKELGWVIQPVPSTR